MPDENVIAVMKSSLSQSGDPMENENFLKSRESIAVAMGKMHLLVSIVRRWDEAFGAIEACKHLVGGERKLMQAKVSNLAQDSVNEL